MTPRLRSGAKYTTLQLCVVVCANILTSAAKMEDGKPAEHLLIYSGNADASLKLAALQQLCSRPPVANGGTAVSLASISFVSQHLACLPSLMKPE